jgi:alpha-amylase
MQYLAGIGEAWGLLPREHAVVFVDNHDTQRGGAELTYKSGALYTLANIFMLAHPYGFPKVCPSDDPTPTASGAHSPHGDKSKRE